MIVRKAFKYRLKVKKSEDRLKLARYAGCCRFVWNKALAVQKERLSNGMRCLPYQEMASLLLCWKRDHPFLREAPSQALQQRLMDLDGSIRDAFDPANPKKFPGFKKKNRSVLSIRYPQGFSINGNSMFLPKLGWISFFNSRKITGRPKNITVSLVGEHWYASVQTEQEVAEPIHDSSSAVGVDFGVKRLITLSDGTYKMPLDALKKSMKKLSDAQRKLARMVKRSGNWKKQKARIREIHIRVANLRMNYLHGISNELSKNHAAIAIEDLRIQDMTVSAKGTKDAPGRNVKQKAGLNRAILDQGWGELKRQIEYKQGWRGGMVLMVDPAYTSQECSCCGHVSPENRPYQELFYCKKCGYTANADENAAKVVKKRAGLGPDGLWIERRCKPSEAETYRVSACADAAGIIGL